MKKDNRLIKPKQLIQSGKGITATTPAKRYSFFPYIIVFFVPVLLYLQTVSFGYIHFDDDMILDDNSSFLSHITNLPHAFVTDAFLKHESLFYRPLQTVSYMFDTLISGNNKLWMYHASNVLLLGCIACALYYLLQQFKISQKLAIFATLLYCLHPLFVSSVAWIPARGDLQLTLFSILSFVFFIEYLQTNKNTHLILHIILFACALFSKETAVVLPFLFACYSITIHNQKFITKKHILLAVIYSFLGMIWFWLRSKAIANVVPTDIVGISAFAPMLRTIPESLTKFILPFDIAPIPSYSLVKTAIGIALLCGIIAALFLSKHGSTKMKLFCLAWFVLFMIPTLFFKHILIDYLDHRFLLPLIGILLFVLIQIPQKWLTHIESKHSWIIVILIIGLTSNSFIKSQAYANVTTFYDEALTKNTKSPLVYYNRGCLNVNKNGDLGTIEEFTKAIELKPDYSFAYNNRGTLYKDNKMYNKAIADFTKAIALDPGNAAAYYNRGSAFQAQNNTEQAINDYNKAISIRPNYAEAFNNRATVYASLHQFDKAIADYTTAISINPEHMRSYFNRGILYKQMGNIQKAIDDYSKAISLNLNSAEVYYNRGIAYFDLHLYDKTIADFSKAAQLGNATAKGNISIYCKGK